MESRNFSNYIKLFEKNLKMNVWHFALMVAVLHLWYSQGQPTIIKVSRSKIMSLAHIKTFPTYHKYFKELQTMGYIKYTPSHHPGHRSEVQLLF